MILDRLDKLSYGHSIKTQFSKYFHKVLLVLEERPALSIHFLLLSSCFLNAKALDKVLTISDWTIIRLVKVLHKLILSTILEAYEAHGADYRE